MARARHGGRPGGGGHHTAASGGRHGDRHNGARRSRAGVPHPHRGHPVSPETRAKISAALKARHPDGPKKRRRTTTAAGRFVAGVRTTRRAATHTARPWHPAGVRRRRGSRHTRLISASTYHTYRGFLHTKTRHHRSRIVIHRGVRAHRVWRKTHARPRRRAL